MVEDKKSDNLELIFSEIKDRLNGQLLSIDQISAKFNVILGFNSVVLVLILQTYLSNSSIDWLLMISGLLLIIAVGVDLVGLYLRKYRRDPEPVNLYNNYKDKSADETRNKLIAHYISCFEENKKRIKRLSNLYKIAVAFTATSIFIIFIY